MTDIVPAPDIPLSSEFPTGADRTAGIFNAKSAGWADTSRTMAAAMDAAAKATGTNAIAANERAMAASQSAQDAEQSRQAAESARDRAEGAAVVVGRFDKLYLGSKSSFPTLDNEGDPLQIGAEFFHAVLKARYSWDGAQWLIGTNVTAGVTQLNGQSGALQLKTIGGESLLGSGNIDASALYRVIRTSDSQLVPGDKSKLIEITAGTFTQTFAAVATLGDGWFCYLRNSGNGDITLDPNASELIDGLTSYVMYPGETRLVQCDGTALRTMVLNAFSKTFTASGSFIDPPGYAICEGLLFGGGGGGGSGVNVFATGGGGGACCPVKLSFIPGTVRTVTIGAGGYAVTAGGNSIFEGFTAYGGGRGIANDGGYGGGGGGTLSAGGAGFTSPAMGGGPALSSISYGPDNMGFGGGGSRGTSVYGGGGGGGSGGGAVGDSGGVSLYGGCGGASAGYSSGGPAAVGIFGGSGGAGSVSGTGGAGTVPAGGGGGAYSGTGGTGARGELRIWGII